MNVIVIGGGPAGMLAAATAAQGGHQVMLLEQNAKLGKKLYITGKGRCNITNAGGQDSFFSHVVHNPRFLYSAYSVCSAEDVVSLMDLLGVPTKMERGDRVFPLSDKSSDVIRALQTHLLHCGVQLRLDTRVFGLLTENSRACGVRLHGGETLQADAVILATGGASYSSTGSTGDGYAFAEKLGHTVNPPLPALVPLETVEDWPKTLSGLTLKNVRLRATLDNAKVFDQLGEMLFAHFGVTGPLVLSASSYIAESPANARLLIDLKPGLQEEQLDRRLLRDIESAQRMSIKNALDALLPRKLLPIVFKQADIQGDASASTFSRSQRQQLVQALKALPLTVRAARPLTEAIITRGGISIKEVTANTLESKLIGGLYFAGEILDVDAETGGYNLQIAWSTGTLAGLLRGA